MNTPTRIMLSIIIAFAIGRYSAPKHEKIEESSQQSNATVEKEDKDVDQDKHKETTVTQVVSPDGTKSTVTKVVEDTKTNTEIKVVDKSNSTQSKSSTTELSDDPITSVMVLAGAKAHVIGLDPPVFGLSITRNILGPITVGAWGLSDRTVGLSLGLSF